MGGQTTWKEVIKMSTTNPSDPKHRVAKLVTEGLVTRVAAICYLHSKGLALLPDGFRHISDSEYADHIADVEEVLKKEPEPTPVASENGSKN